MKRLFLFLGIAIMAGIQDIPAQYFFYPGIALPESANDSKIAGPYFGQPDPGTTPKRFAPSKILAGAWAITFSPDGLECFITQNINDTNTILTSKELSGDWPDLMVADFSGTYMDMESHITPDGQRMYFGSMRPLAGVTPGFLYQWFVDKTDSGWSDPHPMDPPLYDELMMYPSVAASKNMYYTASDGVSSQWIAVSRFINGAYQEPVALDDSINSTPSPAHPFIAPDESYILFDAVTDTANWARDLYICFRKPDSTWTRAINLGPAFNQATYSMFPFVSRDGKYFFFYKDNFTMWVRTDFIEQMRPRYGEWLGETPPDTIPKIFAKDFISTSPNQVYSCCFSPNGNEFYYSNYTGTSNRIWKTERKNGVWTKPAFAPFPQSSWTIEPNFSPDGMKLFFVSDMPDIPPGPPYNPTLRIWVMNRTGSGWGDPHVLQGPFSETIKMFPTVATNGNLYFTDVSDDRASIWMSEWDSGGSYQTPVKLDSAINRFYQQAHPFIAPDESFLIFDASEDGPPDWETYLYISFRNHDGTWRKAEKLPGSINATGSEYCAHVSPDQQYLFFARNTPEGKTYLWWVRTGNILYPTGIEESGYGSGQIMLKQNYPNPFSGQTTIEFFISKKANCRISLLNFYGQELKVIMDETKAPGKYLVETDLSDLTGGIYLYSIYSNDAVITRKMIIQY